MLTPSFPPVFESEGMPGIFFIFFSLSLSFFFLYLFWYFLFLAIEQISYSTMGTRFNIQIKVVVKLAGYW